ncbi:MAG: 2-phospho-L-lactate guanylyltransferase [Gordonia sp. (in: high G+C Gram-positive bacteria)]|uniref:2-phospho-L-lactate guanylyltransferase n=1 Tax=Gordonia sp. (in: high G+C Gram-positive bacteria) TaxID=84139 RepID=UPI0039E628D5
MPDDVVVLAVKDLQRAKSRLGAASVAPAAREALVAAMVADTLGAVRAAGIDRIVLVTPDPRVTELATGFGVLVVPDPGDGLNPALTAGAGAAAQRWAATRVAFLQADLPALTPASLSAALAAAADHPAAFVADRAGEGTALLVTERPVTGSFAVAPAFGAHSAHAHRSAGAVELDPARTGLADLRCDVDTPADLAAAQELGVGPATAAALADVDPGRRSAR